MQRPDECPPAGDGFDDGSMIARVLAGDTQAFAQCVARYERPLYRYAVSMVLDHDAAADMVQDAFVRAYTNLASCRDHRRFRAWLFQTLRNRCLDYLKDARRKTVPLDDVGPLLDRGVSPADHVEHARLRAGLSQALASLPERQREAFLMHHVQDMPYEAMAELLGASVSALKMRVSRAREALASALRGGAVTLMASVRLASRDR
jgi:RNA polymerase sigma-70 factor (ECF subfamily)